MRPIASCAYFRGLLKRTMLLNELCEGPVSSIPWINVEDTQTGARFPARDADVRRGPQLPPPPDGSFVTSGILDPSRGTRVFATALALATPPTGTNAALDIVQWQDGPPTL